MGLGGGVQIRHCTPLLEERGVHLSPCTPLATGLFEGTYLNRALPSLREGSLKGLQRCVLNYLAKCSTIVNQEYKKKCRQNSILSSLKFHPLWVTLYTYICKFGFRKLLH